MFFFEIATQLYLIPSHPNDRNIRILSVLYIVVSCTLSLKMLNKIFQKQKSKRDNNFLIIDCKKLPFIEF